MPHEILAMDYFVPGSNSRMEFERYKGKKTFATILTTSPLTVLTYFQRVTQDCDLLSNFSNTSHRIKTKSSKIIIIMRSAFFRLIINSSPERIHIAKSSFAGLLQKSFAVCIQQEEGLNGKTIGFHTMFKHIFCHVSFGAPSQQLIPGETNAAVR